MPPSSLRIGSRGSALALAQAGLIKAALQHRHPDLVIDIIPMVTSGDTLSNARLEEWGGKGLFTKELEDALLAGDIDVAVHSMKDVPTELPSGLFISCVPAREDPRDVFISTRFPSLDALPSGAVIGTASLRRAAQALSIRPDLVIKPLRGNVATRLQKLERGDCDATFLALAGLKRLGLTDYSGTVMESDIMLPAVGQGALALECNSTAQHIHDMLAPLYHTDTALCTTAERAFLHAISGSCRTPVAALATIEENVLTLRALLASPQGDVVLLATHSGSPHDAEALGRLAAYDLYERQGGKRYLPVTSK